MVIGKEKAKEPVKATRYNVSTPREYEQNGEKKTFWTNVGSGFETESGMMVYLDALPVNGKLFISAKAQATT